MELVKTIVAIGGWLIACSWGVENNNGIVLGVGVAIILLFAVLGVTEILALFD